MKIKYIGGNVKEEGILGQKLALRERRRNLPQRELDRGGKQYVPALLAFAFVVDEKLKLE